ncbi:MAG: 50S ribosomal protein L19e [Candidatus Parvarchaeota archaeon]|jgi:large subunit ribosomal protein L19e|nr:50S ribosomal protein L19e [Candidatus Parvarchaeota archaeon]MCL5017801.1 50S ribosomal protein L19e [Candidatus Parvarchaeota archaeon]
MVAGLKTQRRLASKYLKVGEGKVWLDPSKFKEIKEAITSADVESLIKKGFIKKRLIIGQSRGRARAVRLKKKHGHRKGVGSRKGKKGARSDLGWAPKVRALRNELEKQLKTGKIDKDDFRSFYVKIKGNAFHSVAHMRSVIEATKKEKT